MRAHAHVGMKEIAAMLGVSYQRAVQIRNAYEDFPQPADELARGAIWHLDDVQTWLSLHPHRPSGVRKTVSKEEQR